MPKDIIERDRENHEKAHQEKVAELKAKLKEPGAMKLTEEEKKEFDVS